MFKLLLLLMIAAIPVGLIYAFGFWVLAVIGVLAAVTLLLSTGKANVDEETQGGRLTGYHTTAHAGL